MSHASNAAILMNPCTCEHCTLTKVRHWFCDQCGVGPIRFTMADPGTYRISRPMYVRQKSFYSTTENRWLYPTRYICSKACLEKEEGVITSELIELAGKRPDLAGAAMSQAHEIQNNLTKESVRDDLQEIRPNEGGAYTPGADDL